MSVAGDRAARSRKGAGLLTQVDVIRGRYVLERFVERAREILSHEHEAMGICVRESPQQHGIDD